MDIGKKILQLLEEKKWTPYKLHQEINKTSKIGSSTLSQIITGKKPNPTQKTLRKICDALGVSMAEFDDDTVEITPATNPPKSNDFPSIETVLLALDRAAVTEEEKRAAAKIKAMSKDEQQASFLKVIEKYKSLSAEHQEALAKLINSLPSQK